MSLTLEVVRGLRVEQIDARQPDRFLEPGSDVGFHFDHREWETRYWDSGDPGPLMRAWKERNAPNFYRGLDAVDAVITFMRARRIRLNIPLGFLHVAKFHGRSGDLEEYGLVSAAVVTDVGMQKVVALLNTSDATTGTTFKFHALGTGTNAEAAGDTALQTELTTEYTGNVRATGSQTTGATTKVYRSLGTNTLDSGTPAVTEHGLLSASSVGSLYDRSVFSAINLVGANGDGIASTYDGTYASGG